MMRMALRSKASARVFEMRLALSHVLFVCVAIMSSLCSVWFRRMLLLFVVMFLLYVRLAVGRLASLTRETSGRTLEAPIPKMSGLVKKISPFSKRKNPL